MSKFIIEKTYDEYVEIYKNICEKLGRTIKVKELRKHEFDLPDDKWFVKFCPDKKVKYYRDFIEHLGFKNVRRKYTYEIAFEEFAKRGLYLPPQEYTSCAIKMKFICPNHPDIIQYKSLNSIIFGRKAKHPEYNYNMCNLCFKERQKGEISNAWKGGYSSLNILLREHIDQWKKDSMINCNYKCVITGENFDVIHHLYSFNKIIREVIEKTKLPVHTMVNKYTDEELDLIKQINIKIHNKYHLGVCLRKDIHNLYHHIYGDDNTHEQFEEFKARYNSGEFKDVI